MWQIHNQSLILQHPQKRHQWQWHCPLMTPLSPSTTFQSHFQITQPQKVWSYPSIRREDKSSSCCGSGEGRSGQVVPNWCWHMWLNFRINWNPKPWNNSHCMWKKPGLNTQLTGMQIIWEVIYPTKGEWTETGALLRETIHEADGLAEMCLRNQHQYTWDTVLGVRCVRIKNAN